MRSERMLEELKAMYELQLTDRRLAAFEKDRISLAQAIEDAKKREEEAAEVESEKKAALEEKQKIYRELERDLKEVEDEVRKYKQQQFVVKTNREYSALDTEIRLCAEKTSNLEDKALAVMDEIEALTAEVKDSTAALEKLREEGAREKSDLEQKLARVDEEEATALTEREERQAGVPEDLLNRYEKLRNRNRGEVVARANERACGACFRRITPHDVNLIRRGDRLMTCEGCGSYLIWLDGNEEGSPESQRESNGGYPPVEGSV